MDEGGGRKGKEGLMRRWEEEGTKKKEEEESTKILEHAKACTPYTQPIHTHT